jgi:iron(III) transport system substrate-binding protein
MLMRLIGFAAGALTAVLAATAVNAQELTVYTALEADQIKAYQAAFEKSNPGIKVRWVRDSTGVVTAKLLAEKADPKADVVFGLAATSLMLLDKEGMLQGYTPEGLDKIKKTMRDPAEPPKWVGMDIWASAACFNTIEAGKKSIPAPKSWADLTKPEYKGQIAMPNPASSGTGYLMVAGWLQMMGEEAGWKFMDALHQNVGSYTHSGSKPCRQAAAGEYVVGLSFEYRANKTKKDGAPIEAILPSEGLGWDMEASSIMATTKQAAAAKKLLDWSVTEGANRLYAENFAIVAYPGVQAKLEHVKGDVEQMLGKNDFAWSAANRDRVLAEWTKRYDGKSEAK